MKVLTEGGKIARLDDPIDIFNYFDERGRKLKVIEGGKGTSSGNWLANLPVDAIFLTEDLHNQGNFAQLRLQVVQKYEEGEKVCAVVLYENLVDKPFACVNPDRFCRQYRLVKIVYNPELEEQNG